MVMPSNSGDVLRELREASRTMADRAKATQDAANIVFANFTAAVHDSLVKSGFAVEVDPVLEVEDRTFTDDLDACDPLPEAEVGAQASEGIRYVNMPEVFAPRGYTDIEEAEVGAQPPIESTDPPAEGEERIVVTSHSIRVAYHDLYMATAAAFVTAEKLAQDQVTLKVAEMGPWPGNNETERKAAQARATFEEKERLIVSESNHRKSEVEIALAKIHVDELRMQLHLAEWTQREDERERAEDMGF